MYIAYKAMYNQIKNNLKIKKIGLILILVFLGLVSNAQNQVLSINYAIGHGVTSDKFTYDGKNIGNYSLGWYTVPDSAEARLSGYGGVNFFTNRISRLKINHNGNVGIGTTNPSALLEIRQKEDSGSDKGLIISEPNNSQKIYLHLANNASGEYGYLALGGSTKLRGNGKLSSFDGVVGIGTTNTKGFRLGVNGKIAAEEVKIALYGNWSDFVFYDDYNLPTLTEVEKHIKEKGHLKDIPSAATVAKNGIFLGEMDAKLLQKIEELTLYTIEQEKNITIQKQEI